MKALLTALLTLAGVAGACGVVDAPTHAAVEEAAAREGLPRELLSALVWTESAFCPAALSRAGAIGYGQLMPGTARDLGVNPHDPLENLRGAARYLRAQWDAFGDWTLALAAYNAGPGAVLKYGRVPPYPETQRYVVRVLNTYSQLLNAFVRAPTTPTQVAAPRAAVSPPRVAASPTGVTASPTPARPVQATASPARTTTPPTTPPAQPAIAAPLTVTVVRPATPTDAPSDPPSSGLTVIRPLTPQNTTLTAALSPTTP